MKTFLLLFILSNITYAITNISFSDSSQNGFVGKVWPSEKKTWIDQEFGKEITKWTSDKYTNWHLYFNIESFVDENNFIIYSNRTGFNNLFKLRMENGSILQLTNHKQNVGGSVWHYPNYSSIWYLLGNSIRVLNYKTMEDLEVINETGSEIISFTVTMDLKYIVYSMNKNPGYSSNHSSGPYAIFRFDLKNKKREQISPDYGMKLNHLQASPTNPELVTYAWQHQYRPGGEGIVGYIPIRIWWLNIEKKEGAPLIPQEFGIHRTHEFWLYDGSRIGYSARYIFGEKKGKQYLGSCKYDGSDNFMIEAPIDAAHSQIFKDNKHWVADINNGNYLTLWKFERDKFLSEQKLYKHESSWEGQPSHPHPRFSPNGKYILFSTDKTGSPQVYTVKINLNENQK